MAESKARGLLRDLAAGGRIEALPDGLTAQALAESASDQGVSGLLLAGIERARPAWAEPVTESLAARRRALLVRTLGQIGLAARCVSLLEAHGIRALPLKGVVLAETVYDVESDRPMSDVDLLALERWPEAVLALRSAGFAEVARGDHAWAFRDPEGREVVELHRSVVSAPGLFPLDPEGLWARSRAGRGQLGRLPSPEDLLLQLALHAAFQHGLVPLARAVARLPARARARDDRRPAPAGARRRPGRGAPRAALLAAEAVVAAPLPASLRPRLPAGLRRWLAPRLGEPLAFVAPSAPDLARVRWALLAGRRAELVWRTLVLPETPEGDERLAARVRSPSGAACASRAGRPERRSSRRPTTSASRPWRPRASRSPSARSCCATASPRSPTCG